MSRFLQRLVDGRFGRSRRCDRSSRSRVSSDEGRFGFSRRTRFSSAPTLIPDGSFAPVSSGLSAFSALLLHELSGSVVSFCNLGGHLHVFGTGTVLFLGNPEEKSNHNVSPSYEQGHAIGSTATHNRRSLCPRRFFRSPFGFKPCRWLSRRSSSSGSLS